MKTIWHLILSDEKPAKKVCAEGKDGWQKGKKGRSYDIQEGVAWRAVSYHSETWGGGGMCGWVVRKGNIRGEKKKKGVWKNGEEGTS